MGARAFDRRYSDRDVRENWDEFLEVARNYLRSYGGEFDPLVDAQREVRRTGTLTVTSLRKTLNCMRHDWYVQDSLPIPARYREAEDTEKSNVIPLRLPPRPIAPPNCRITEYHVPHRIEPIFEGQRHRDCPGKRNDRTDVVRPLTGLNKIYVLGKTGNLIHLAHHDLEKSWVVWYVDRWGSGFTHKSFNIKVMCTTPSRLVNPILLDREQAENLVRIGWRKVKNMKDPLHVGLCRKCFPEGI